MSHAVREPCYGLGHKEVDEGYESHESYEGDEGTGEAGAAVLAT